MSEDELAAMSQSERMRLAGLFVDMLAMDHPLLIGKWTPRYAILSGQGAASLPPGSDKLLGPGDGRKSPQVVGEPETLAEAVAASAA